MDTNEGYITKGSASSGVSSDLVNIQNAALFFLQIIIFGGTEHMFFG